MTQPGRIDVDKIESLMGDILKRKEIFKRNHTVRQNEKNGQFIVLLGTGWDLIDDNDIKLLEPVLSILIKLLP